MNTLVILTLSLLCVGLGTTLRTPPTHLLRTTERNLLQLMVDTRAQQRADPERTLACFDYYLPLFDALNEQYKENYAACLDEADGRRGELDASTQPQRDSIEKSAKSSCEAFRDCSKLSDSISYFSCFVDSGKGNTEVMYEISANSAETLASVRESYRLIENSEYRCTNASERHYIEQSYQGNLHLQSCLRGDSVPPTSTPIPSTTPTDETTTEEPGSETTDTTVTPTEEPGSETTDTTAVPTEEPGSEATDTTVAQTEETGSETTDTTVSPTEEPGSETTDTTVAQTEEPASENTDTTAVPTEEPELKEELMPEEDLFKLRGLNWDEIRDVLRKQLKQGHYKRNSEFVLN